MGGRCRRLRTIFKVAGGHPFTTSAHEPPLGSYVDLEALRPGMLDAKDADCRLYDLVGEVEIRP